MCKNRKSKIFKNNVAVVKFTRVVYGGPGSPWVTFGGSLGAPGGAFLAPREDFEDQGRHSGGSPRGPQIVNKSSRSVLFEIPEGQIHIFPRF